VKTADGSKIPIEERSAAEVTHVGSRQLVPNGVGVRHPGFDVTPANLVTAIVTERGVAEPPSSHTIATIAPR
jgi:methylthioribose-1-phosphate isomerase